MTSAQLALDQPGGYTFRKLVLTINPDPARKARASRRPRRLASARSRNLRASHSKTSSSTATTVLDRCTSSGDASPPQKALSVFMASSAQNRRAKPQLCPPRKVANQIRALCVRRFSAGTWIAQHDAPQLRRRHTPPLNESAKRATLPQQPVEFPIACHADHACAIPAISAADFCSRFSFARP
jgi:hypothetical protein